MDISEKLFQLKFHISFAVALSLLILSHIYLAPSFIDLLAYFWPLFVSTAMFLSAVVLFGRTSPQAAGEKAGEGLLDYVAGQNQPEEVPTAEANHPVEVQPAEESPESEKNK